MKIVLCILLLAIVASASAKKKVVCYYEGWAAGRPGEGKYTMKNIDVKLCTHVAYAFAGLKSNGDIKRPDDNQNLKQFTNYIKQHGAKSLLSIGGASEGSQRFSAMANNPEARSKFVKNAVNFLKEHGFDGLDVDWEYPNQGSGSRKSDKDNFVELLKELHAALSKHGYSLSAAVGADPDSGATSYKIAQIAKYLDFINIMSYDYNGSWNSFTGMNAPLYASRKDDSYQKTLNVESTVRYWLSQGAPANKIIVGIPFYGRSFTLKESGKHGLYAPTSGPGKAGPITKEAGYLGYNELCVMLHSGGWNIVREKDQHVPYAYKGKTWMTYDDPQSIKEKVEYINSKGLGGAMIWSIDTDDFHGKCGRKNALLNTIHDTLKNCKNVKDADPHQY